MEACQIRVVGDEHIEFMQGRPFGFEVECVTASGQPTQGWTVAINDNNFDNGYGDDDYG